MYKHVGVQRAATASRYVITLDERVLKTPAKHPLELPNEALAWAIATEWDAQTKRMAPHTMPLMKLATTAIDQARAATPADAPPAAASRPFRACMQAPSIRHTMQDSMLRCLQTDGAAVAEATQTHA